MKYGGYRLTESLPVVASRVERWAAVGPAGHAEVYVGGGSLLKRGRGLPAFGPFPQVDWGEEGGRAYVLVPGRLARDLTDLGRELDPGAALVVGWHLVTALAELHENGDAHGALDPDHAGIDDLGRLVVRPALGGAGDMEPDPAASAQATDCLALGRMLEALRVELCDDDRVLLLMRGLRRDRARLRLHPGRSVRQSLSAILHRHPDYEAAAVEALGSSWALDGDPFGTRDDHRPRAAPELPPPHAEEAVDDPSSRPYERGPARLQLRPDGAAATPLSGLPAAPAAPPADPPAPAAELPEPAEPVGDDDTAVGPVPEDAAAEIVEDAPLPEDGEDDAPPDGEHLAAGRHGAPVAVDALPPGALDAPDPAAPDPAATLGSDLSEVVDPSEVLDAAEADEEDLIDAATSEEALPDLSEPPAEEEQAEDEPSSALAGVATVHHGREEIPAAALDVPEPEEEDEEEEEAVEEEEEADDGSAHEEEEEAVDEAVASPPPSLAALGPPPPAGAGGGEDAPEPEPEPEPEASPPPSLAALGPPPPAGAGGGEAAPEPEPEASPPSSLAALGPPPPAGAGGGEAAPEPEPEPVPARVADRAAALDGALADARLDGGLDEPDLARGDVPKWAGVRGVTGDSSREAELGKGKWLEEGRDMKELTRELGDAPVRELTIDDEGPGMGVWIGVAVAAAVLALLGWLFLGGSEEQTPGEAPAAAAPAPPAPTAVAEAVPEGPSVRVISEPAGARISLDGTDLGVGPIVSVPTDGATHELCATLEGERRCRELTAEAMLLSDPYVFRW